MYPGVKRSFDYLTKRRYRKAAKFRFAAPKQARPCPSGIGGLQGQGRAGHASIRDLLELIRIFCCGSPPLRIVPNFCPRKSESVQTKIPNHAYRWLWILGDEHFDC